MKKFFLSASLLLALVAGSMPLMAIAAGPSQAQAGTSGGSSGGSCNLSGGDLRAVVGCIVYIFNYAVYLLQAGAVVYIVYGAFLMITNEEKRESGKQIIYYGIIGLFVMISIWGFVNILKNTFGLSGVQSNTVIPQGDFIQPRG